MSNNQHVIRYGDSWAVRKEGNTKVTVVFDSKQKAISEAKRIVKHSSFSVIIYNSVESLGSTDKREGLFSDR